MITTYSELLMPTLHTTEQSNLSEEEEKKKKKTHYCLSGEKNEKYKNRQKYIDLNEILLFNF